MTTTKPTSLLARIVACWVALVPLGLLAGCSGTEPAEVSEPTESGPYAARIRQARVGASDFVLKILHDGVITEAELQESRERVTECVANSGLNIYVEYFSDEYGFWSYNWGANHTGEPTMAEEQTIESCHREWAGGWEHSIEQLHRSMVTNPNDEDWDELVTQCLVRHEVVAPEFTVADYQEARERWYDALAEVPCEPPPDPDRMGCMYSGDTVFPVLELPGGVTTENNLQAQACGAVPLR